MTDYPLGATTEDAYRYLAKQRLGQQFQIPQSSPAEDISRDMHGED